MKENYIRKSLLLVLMFALPAFVYSQNDSIIYDTVVIVEEPVVINKTIFIEDTSSSVNPVNTPDTTLINEKKRPEIELKTEENKNNGNNRQKNENKHSLSLFYGPGYLSEKDLQYKSTEEEVLNVKLINRTSHEFGFSYHYFLNSALKIQSGLSILSLTKSSRSSTNSFIETITNTSTYYDTTDIFYQIIGNDTVVNYTIIERTNTSEEDIYELKQNNYLSEITCLVIPLGLNYYFHYNKIGLGIGLGGNLIVPVIKKGDIPGEYGSGRKSIAEVTNNISFGVYSSLNIEYNFNNKFFAGLEPHFTQTLIPLYSSEFIKKNKPYYFKGNIYLGINF
jgi:hypothetical protein